MNCKEAPEKTQVAIMEDPYKPGKFSFVMSDHIIPNKDLRCLGVKLDWKLSFVTQVKLFFTNDEKTLAALTKLMPNISDPKCKSGKS